LTSSSFPNPVTDIQQKQVKIAELQADAVQKVKAAEDALGESALILRRKSYSRDGFRMVRWGRERELNGIDVNSGIRQLCENQDGLGNGEAARWGLHLDGDQVVKGYTA
jgi:hypothetical protein